MKFKSLLILFLICLSFPPSSAHTNGIAPTANPLTRRAPQNSRDATQVYYGGPVLETPEIFIIFWGPRQSHSYPHKTTQFYSDLVDSAYFDNITQYSTLDQDISPPSYRGSYLCEYCRGRAVSASNIRWKVNDLVTREIMPKVQIYAIHFGKDITAIATDGSESCQSDGFCGYHGHGHLPDASLYAYTVIPDFRAGVCRTHCGVGANRFDDMTAIASHEIVESIVDPMIQDAYTYGPPLGWYSVWEGEIGDACAMRHKEQVKAWEGGVWVVQEYWSNEVMRCV
jgi:hypothetical protein